MIKRIYKKLKTVLDSNTACAAGEIPSDVIVDPTFGSFSGGVQDFEHGVGNAEGDLNIGAGQGLEDEGIGIEELDFGDVVGVQEVHDLGRRKRVGRRRAPVEADGCGWRKAQGGEIEEEEEENEAKIRRHYCRERNVECHREERFLMGF